MSEKEEMDKDRSKLRQDLEALKAKRIEELADKDREKVQATDKLKNGRTADIQICSRKSMRPRLVCFR